MSDNTTHLILEYLRHIRGRVDQLVSDVRDVKARLLSIEHHQAAGYLDSTRQAARLDELDDRMQRLETRLELRDAP